jgi:hypothetical protein
MRRGLKLGLGIPLTLIGLFMTIGGVAIVAWVGPDGSFTLPDARAVSNGKALVFDDIAIDRHLPASGNLATTLQLSVRGNGKDVFVGVGPAALVARYLRGVPVDRIVQVNWPGGVRTEAVAGSASPDGSPETKRLWIAQAHGPTASIRWTLASGAWTVVIMNADASSDVDVTGTASVTLPVLGPIGVAALLVGLAFLLAGILLTISGSRMPKAVPLGGAPAPVGAPPEPPAPPGAGTGLPPPRPDGT